MLITTQNRKPPPWGAPAPTGARMENDELQPSGAGVSGAPLGLRQPGVGVDQKSEDAQDQVYEVVDDGVAVGEQPEEVGQHEAEHADQKVDHAHRYDHAAGYAYITLQARKEQQTSRGDVNQILQYVDVLGL